VAAAVVVRLFFGAVFVGLMLDLPYFFNPAAASLPTPRSGGHGNPVVDGVAIARSGTVWASELVNVPDVFGEDVHAPAQMCLLCPSVVEPQSAIYRDGHEHHNDGER